jgi:MFS family permease
MVGGHVGIHARSHPGLCVDCVSMVEIFLNNYTFEIISSLFFNSLQIFSPVTNRLGPRASCMVFKNVLIIVACVLYVLATHYRLVELFIVGRFIVGFAFQ